MFLKHGYQNLAQNIHNVDSARAKQIALVCLRLNDWGYEQVGSDSVVLPSFFCSIFRIAKGTAC